MALELVKTLYFVFMLSNDFLFTSHQVESDVPSFPRNLPLRLSRYIFPLGMLRSGFELACGLKILQFSEANRTKLVSKQKMACWPWRQPFRIKGIRSLLRLGKGRSRQGLVQ